MRHLTSLKELSKSEILELLDLADNFIDSEGFIRRDPLFPDKKVVNIFCGDLGKGIWLTILPIISKFSKYAEGRHLNNSMLKNSATPLLREVNGSNFLLSNWNNFFFLKRR